MGLILIIAYTWAGVGDMDEGDRIVKGCSVYFRTLALNAEQKRVERHERGQE